MKQSEERKNINVAFFVYKSIELNVRINQGFLCLHSESDYKLCLVVNFEFTGW